MTAAITQRPRSSPVPPQPCQQDAAKVQPSWAWARTKDSEKEEIQEFLKRVRKFSAGAVRLIECDASIAISLKHEVVVTAGVAGGCLGPGWPCSGIFLLLLYLPAQLPTKDGWCISQPLVFSTFQEELWHTSPCRPHSSLCFPWECLQDPCAGEKSMLTWMG